MKTAADLKIKRIIETIQATERQAKETTSASRRRALNLAIEALLEEAREVEAGR